MYEQNLPYTEQRILLYLHMWLAITKYFIFTWVIQTKSFLLLARCHSSFMSRTFICKESLRV